MEGGGFCFVFLKLSCRDYFSPTEQAWFPGHWTRRVYWRARTEAVLQIHPRHPHRTRVPVSKAKLHTRPPPAPGVTSLAVHGSTLEGVTTFIFQGSYWKMTAPRAVTRASPVPPARARASHLSNFPIRRSFSQARPGLTDYSQIAPSTTEANPF